jgi:hypothetical protein
MAPVGARIEHLERTQSVGVYCSRRCHAPAHLRARLHMPGSKKRRSRSNRRKVAASGPYEVGYFAKKHDITPDQARELIRRIGNDRDKLNEAASRLFRK